MNYLTIIKVTPVRDSDVSISNIYEDFRPYYLSYGTVDWLT